jgi:prepilin-type processing-associated H-X9-DG protein
MTELKNQQKQLLFDYCLGLTSEEATAEAEQLIASNEQAAEIHSKLKTALSPLNSLKSESCPDDLAEGTIWRLNNLARSSQLRLEQLLASEQARGVTDKRRFWKNLGEIVAVAAVIVFVAGVLIAPLNLARQKSRQHACQMQLLRIGQGIKSYSDDHDGKLPAVTTAMGAPWWKVGYQGKENHSNTRHIWLLVKGEYVEPVNFVCPGRSQSRALQFDPSQVQNYNDFPSRKYVTYSFRIRCSKPREESPHGRKVLIADLNPLFERLPNDYSKPFNPIQLNKDLLNLNSINHNRRGQNVLFCDGSAKFIKKRHTDISTDDIFTLQDTNTYEGIEVPSCETDAFLAP